LAAAGPAKAVPAFAAQTGQPCQQCHVGGFGPQLTPYGRNFKMGGYTTRSGPINVPLAVMAVASYLNTQKDQEGPPPGFHDNNNVALDQVSVFIAGGVGQHFGGFAQVTYDGIGESFTWDNTDLRAVDTKTFGKTSVLYGVSLNNNPTVQDAWNTLPAWGFPYTTSALAPSGPAAPLIQGALAQEVIGATGYAWINAEVYLEAGAYGSPSTRFLRNVGADPIGPGDIDGLAPYARFAWQKTFGEQTLEGGAFFLRAGIFPGRDRSAGASDVFTDAGIDGSDYVTLKNGDIVTVNASYTHEQQDLNASQPLGLAANAHDTIDDVRGDVAYYWRNKIGVTFQAFATTGSPDPLLYAESRTARPDTTGVTFQIDGTPFGGEAQPKRRLNLRVGLQYTAYARFSGAATDFDGAGRRASDNNTLRLFTWTAF
jgi:hypothetical protein